MSKFELPRFTIEDLRNLPVKEVDAAYWGYVVGHQPYCWWHQDDAMFVEEILDAARRRTLLDLDELKETVEDLLGEKGIEEARSIAEFRAKLQLGRQCRL